MNCDRMKCKQTWIENDNSLEEQKIRRREGSMTKGNECLTRETTKNIIRGEGETGINL